jgi:tetratricopeptide (TPR) repeat protein
MPVKEETTMRCLKGCGAWFCGRECWRAFLTQLPQHEPTCKTACSVREAWQRNPTIVTAEREMMHVQMRCKQTKTCAADQLLLSLLNAQMVVVCAPVVQGAIVLCVGDQLDIANMWHDALAAYRHAARLYESLPNYYNVVADYLHSQAQCARLLHWLNRKDEALLAFSKATQMRVTKRPGTPVKQRVRFWQVYIQLLCSVVQLFCDANQFGNAEATLATAFHSLHKSDGTPEYADIKRGERGYDSRQQHQQPHQQPHLFAHTLATYGFLLLRQANYDESATVLLDALVLLQKLRADNSEDGALVLLRLALAKIHLQRPSMAGAFAERARDVFCAIFGESSAQVAECKSLLAIVLQVQGASGNLDKALQLHDAAVSTIQHRFGTTGYYNLDTLLRRRHVCALAVQVRDLHAKLNN